MNKARLRGGEGDGQRQGYFISEAFFETKVIFIIIPAHFQYFSIPLQLPSISGNVFLNNSSSGVSLTSFDFLIKFFS